MAFARSKWRQTGLGFLAFLLFVVALHFYLNGSHARTWVLSRVKEHLVSELGAFELGDRFSVDWIGRVTIGPLTIADERGPILSAASLRVRPAYRRLLMGRVEPAAITLDKVNIDLDRALNAYQNVSESRNSSRAPGKSRLPGLQDIGILANEIHFQTAQPELQQFLRGLEPLSGKLGLHRSLGDWRASGDLRFKEHGRSTIDVAWGHEQTLKLRLNLEAPRVGSMFHELEALPLTIKEGTLLAELAVNADHNFNQATASLNVTMRNLLLAGERLHSGGVGPFDLQTRAKGSWDRSGREIQLANIALGISDYQPLPLEMTGRLDLGPERNIDLEAAIQKLDFPRLLRALPAELSPGDEVPPMLGFLTAQFRLKGPTRHPEKLELNAKLDLSGLRARQSSVPLASTFEYRPGRENGKAPVIVVGEKNPNFVPLAQIPSVLVSAVVLSEDAGFWGHRGFDFQEIKESLLDAAEEKRFRGASTITQQLAKNLYFAREKTYARKIREAIATLMLEASLPKSRILEIYLNIIEWGPDIYGIGQAAQHYFGRDVREITPKQAAFLASIIPNPIKYYVYYRQGALSEIWENRVHELLIKMKEHGLLNEEEFVQAEETPIVFAASK